MSDQIRHAASVVAFREGAEGAEILVVERGPSSRFLASYVVFPGGAVDPPDREAAASMDSDVEADELAHRICGARELGEEAAVPLAADTLFPWSRWVTPAIVPIRFDTRFYVALAPAHCKPHPDFGEVDEARWIAPEIALAEHGRDELALSFPTIKHLEELTGYPDADAVIAEGRSRYVEAITPQVKGDRDNFEVLLPGDPGFADR